MSGLGGFVGVPACLPGPHSLYLLTARCRASRSTAEGSGGYTRTLQTAQGLVPLALGYEDESGDEEEGYLTCTEDFQYASNCEHLAPMLKKAYN